MSTRTFARTQPAPGALTDRLAAHGDRTALVEDGVRLSYDALAGRVREAAEVLGPVRRLVLVEIAASVDSVVAYLGALAGGHVVLLTGPATDPDLAAAYRPDVRIGPGGLADLTELTEGTAHDLHPDLALLLSTSGSTGSPKLVRLSRDNLVANAVAIADYLGLREDDLAATALPLHYCYGLSVLHSHLVAGAGVLLTSCSVTDPAFWEEFRRHGATSFAGVPHTFDLLDRSGFADLDLPRLRYATQAGGRLGEQAVRRWAELGRRRGFDFVVMYGATEATARMAWLPADRALSAPTAIGRPIPGGAFTLEPVEGAEPGEGELVYHGPNVMLGYAETPADLALGRTVAALRTGDLGRRRADGLFEVVGRRSRIAKVFGLRLDLDRVERVLAGQGVVAAAADGGDRLVLGIVDGARPVPVADVLAVVHDRLGIPAAGVSVTTWPDLPRLASGKVDYPALVRAAGSSGAGPTGSSIESVVGLYADLLGRPDAGPGDSFVDLGGDSLSYVEVSLRLERLLGSLPADWHTRSAADLVGAPATRRGALVESSVLLRAFAIVSIVGTHANVFTLLGGAHLLLAVAGFNFARFQLTSRRTRTERGSNLVRSVGRIALPAAAVIATVSLWTDGLGWRQALLLNGLSHRTWSEPQWYYWFVEAIVYILLALAVVLAVPAVDRLERRHPFGLPVGLTIGALVTRYGLVGIEGGDQIHRAHVVFWLFALGWAAARATSTWHRLVLSAIAVGSVPGFFDEGARNAYVAAGLVALVWLPHLRVPAAVARVAGVLAASSLWIYLVHWQVYPWLEHRVPILALLLSLVAGVLAHRAWDAGAGRVRATWTRAISTRPSRLRTPGASRLVRIP